MPRFFFLAAVVPLPFFSLLPSLVFFFAFLGHQYYYVPSSSFFCLFLVIVTPFFCRAVSLLLLLFRLLHPQLYSLVSFSSATATFFLGGSFLLPFLPFDTHILKHIHA